LQAVQDSLVVLVHPEQFVEQLPQVPVVLSFTYIPATHEVQNVGLVQFTQGEVQAVHVVVAK